MSDEKDGTKYTQAEIVYLLMGWLTAREEPVTLSAQHNAAPAADLAKEFCELWNLGEPREEWAHIGAEVDDD